MYIRKELSSKVLHHCTVYALHRNSKGFCHSSLGSMWCVNAHLRNHKQAGQYDISLWCNYYTHMRVTSLWGLRRSMTNDYANAYQTKALYSLTVTHMMMRKCVPHTQHITHSFYYQWFMQMCTKQKLYSLYSLTLTHMMIYAIAYHTQNITHQCIKTMKFVIRHTHIRIYKILSYLYAYTHMRKRRVTRGRT